MKQLLPESSLPHLVTVLVIITGLVIWWQVTLGFQAFTWEAHRRLQIEAHPIVVPPIKLQDQKGKIFDFASLRGQIIAVNFIYTRCPTVCGVTGLNYARLQNRIQESGYRDKVSLLSITLDPQYDTPPKLNQYLQRFTRTQYVSWRAARPLQLANGHRFLQELGVVSIPDGLGGFVHNAATHIVDQKGRLVRIISEDNLDKTLAAIKQLL